MMSNFVPHDQYRKFITQQVQRVTLSAATSHKFSVAAFIMATILTLLLLHRPMFFGDPGFGFIFWLASVYFVLLAFFRLLFSDKIDFDNSITCPHCEGRLTLNKDYTCGTCGQANKNTATKIIPYSISLDPCTSCNDVTHSLMCPMCGNDIVFDLEAYNKAEKVGFGFAGTRKLI